MSMLSDAVDALETATNDELVPAADAAIAALGEIPVQTDRIVAVTGTISDTAAALNAAVNPPVPPPTTRRKR